MKPFWKVNRQGADPIVGVTPTDDEMNEAISSARASLDQFFENFNDPKASQAPLAILKTPTCGHLKNTHLRQQTVGNLFQVLGLCQEPMSSPSF